MQITQRNKNMSTKWLVVVAACLMVALFVVIAVPPFVGWFINNFNGDDASASIAKPAATSTPSPTPTADDCAPEFTQVALDRQGSPKVNPNFQAEYDAVVASGVANQERATLLVTSGHNGQLLAAYANQMGLPVDISQTAQLLDGTCLSKEGQDLYNQLSGAYHLKDVTFKVVTEVPADAINSGVDPSTGLYGVDASRGIRGDSKAIEITLPDGSKTWVMFRCGNPVFMAPPSNLPKVLTDNPPPPNNPPEKPKTSDAKNRADSVTPVQGWDPQPAGQQTTDHISEDQHASGEVSGNVGQVPSGTQIGTTTPDTGPVVPVQGATPSDGSSGQPAEDTSNDVVDDTVTNQDPGGSTGDTEIAPPPD